MSKKARTPKRGSPKGELLPFYDLSKIELKPNRFAGIPLAQMVVMPDPDLSKIYKTPEAVNKALRGLLDCLPAPAKRKSSSSGNKSAVA